MSSRRNFVKKITVSLAGLSFLGMGAKRSGLRETELRVAIMGLGSYGDRVAKAMQTCEKAKLTGVISGTPSKVKDWQKKYSIPDSNCYNYENFDKIRDNPNIDAVYVITPNGLHHDQVIRVARGGEARHL